MMNDRCEKCGSEVVFVGLDPHTEREEYDCPLCLLKDDYRSLNNDLIQILDNCLWEDDVSYRSDGTPERVVIEDEDTLKLLERLIEGRE